jgi:hypothetical protein
MSSRLLRAQTLTVEFIKPAQLLAETNIAVRSTSDVSEQISKWWCFFVGFQSLQIETFVGAFVLGLGQTFCSASQFFRASPISRWVL